MAGPSTQELDMRNYIKALEKNLNDRTEEALCEHQKYRELKEWIQKVMEDPYAGPLMKQAIARYKLANFGYEEHTSF